MRLTSKVNLTKRFSEKYKRMRLTTRLYSMAIHRKTLSHTVCDTDNPMTIYGRF